MFIQSLIIALSLGASGAWAAESTPWEKAGAIRCQKEFKSLVGEKKWDKEMFREHISSSRETVYRNLSHVIGEWVEVHIKDDTSPEVYLLKEASIKRFSFDKGCDLKISPESLPMEFEKAYTKKTAEDWGDAELKALLSSGKKGMIYYWSPKFVYSLNDLNRMEKLAKKFGYEFTAVVDPRATKEEIEDALDVLKKNSGKKRKVASATTFLRNTSIDLYMRGGFNHFPVTYIYNNQMIHPRWVTGIMTDNGLKAMADTLAGELK